ncbi:MAG TPA: DUF6531 domain-containing protein, partial [Solirubrobacterales bacterium]
MTSRGLERRSRQAAVFALFFVACVALALLANPALDASRATSSSPEEPQMGISDAVVAGGPDATQSAETEEAAAPEDDAPDDIPAPLEDEATAEGAVAAAPEDAWLHSPEAVRQRQESRTAFDDLSAAQAEGVLSGAFADTLEQLDGDPSRLLSDLELEEVVDTYGALVAGPDGGSQLVEFPIPVRDRDPGENAEPVDLALEPAEDAFVSDTPAGKVKLPRALGQEIRVDENFGIASLPGRPEVSAARFGDKDLFLANADTDTDTFVAPLTAGVEVFQQLRSPRSPQRFRFALTLPKGASLRPDGTGGVQIVSADEKRLGFIPAPYALDAQGTNVPVSMAIEGDAVVVDIPHRSLDVAYPLLLDPEFVVEEMYWNGGNTSGLSAWGWQETADYDPYTNCIPGGSCWSTGLYARSKGNNYWYGPSTWGQWVYTAPNTTAYISRTIFWTLRGSTNNCFTKEPHGYTGIYNYNTGAYNNLGIYSPPNFSATSYDTVWSGGVGVRAAVVGIGTGGSASQLACGHDLYAGGATIYQDDPEIPTVNSVTGYPTGWVKDNAPFTITANVSDPGLGVQGAVLAPDETAATSKSVGCTGLHNSRCPSNYSFQFPISADSFDEGEKGVRLSATDATKKTSTTVAWKMKIDRTPPEVKLAGQLAVATEEDEGEEKDPEKWDALALPVYNLKIEATDVGTRTNVPPDANKRSGVKSITVLLDGVTKNIWTQNCPDGSCPMTQTFQLKLNELSALTHHTLRVTVRDQAENMPRVRNIEFEFVPATGMKEEYVLHRFPLPTGQGDEAEEEDPVRPELAVNVMNGNLVYRELDLEVPSPAVDLAVERYYNSLLPESQNTEWGDGWTLAQTPTLEAEEGEAPGGPEATLVEESGAVDSKVELPEETGEEIFDEALQAVVSKEASGYTLTDESGDTESTLAFNEAGEATELRAPGYAEIDYAYEEGDLSEIAIDDPGATDFTVEEAEEWEALQNTPTFATSLGSHGTGPGQFDYAGDVGQTSTGELWVADPRNHRIQKLDE